MPMPNLALQIAAFAHIYPISASRYPVAPHTAPYRLHQMPQNRNNPHGLHAPRKQNLGNRGPHSLARERHRRYAHRTSSTPSITASDFSVAPNTQCPIQGTGSCCFHTHLWPFGQALSPALCFPYALRSWQEE